jgi:hypothetical protein
VEQRLFSLEEANALIPKLEIIMSRMQRRAAELRRGIEALARECGQSPDDLNTSDILTQRPGLRPVVDELEELVAEIEECGGQFKGLDLGLVDFPAELNGEIVLLCWQFGEKEIAYWHTVENGFAGREPLPGRGQRGPVLQ